MFILADVIAICFVAVGIATFDHQLYQKVYHCCCYYFLMADVLARMANGVVMLMIGKCCCRVTDVFCHYYVVLFCWQMLLPGG